MLHRRADLGPVASLFVCSVGAVALARVSGCATPGDSSLTFFADPAKYQYSSCEQLAVHRQTWDNQRAGTEAADGPRRTGGWRAVVNVLAYKGDYAAATEELKLLERAARSRHRSTPENWSSSSAIR